MKRSPLRRKTPLARGSKPLKRGSRLKPVSDKKAEWNRKYMAAKRTKMADQKRISGHTYCERCLKPCKPDGHHPGKQVGEAIMRFFLLCRKCHDWLHFEDPVAARAEGWLD